MSFTTVNLAAFTGSYFVADSRTIQKVIYLPTASAYNGKMITVKDIYGSASTNSILFSTTGIDYIDDVNSQYTMSNALGCINLLSDGGRSWRTLDFYNGSNNFSQPGKYPAVTTDTVPRAIPSGAVILRINTVSSIKTFTMPTVSTNPGRLLIFKDYLGNSSTNPIYLSTTGLDILETANYSALMLSANYGTWTFLNDGITRWFLTNVYANTVSLSLPPFPRTAMAAATTFLATSNYQSYTVPTGVSFIYIVAWGAGGGSYDGYNSPPGIGGGGACVKGYLPVTPGETLRLIVGVGGLNDQSAVVPTDAWGGGGQGRGGGGGRTAIQRVNGTDLFVVGGGGGGGIANGDVGGAATASETAWRGNNTARATTISGYNGGGGSQTQGGNPGGGSSLAGSLGKGGFAQGGGAGGGGWYGGGGGYAPGGIGSVQASAGGGSSMTSNLFYYGIQLFDGSGSSAANSADTLRAGIYGDGKNMFAQGGHGVLYITPYSS